MSARIRALSGAVTTALIAPLLAVGSATIAHAEEAACSLHANPHETEWLSCMSVSASLDRLPAVGETAILSFEVTAEFDRPDVVINADLPIWLDWEQPPAGMAARPVSSPAPADRGRLNRATGVFSFTAGQTRRFEGRAVAAGAGLAHIAVRVFAPADEEGEAATDHVYLTVAERGGTSTPGFAMSAESTTTPGEPPTARPLRYKPANVHAAPAAMAAPLAGTACVTGGWEYRDNLNIIRPSVNYTVELWDKDFADPTDADDDLLAVVLTDGNGIYSACFNNDDLDAFVHDEGQDVYTVMVSDNDNWRVQKTGTGELFRFRQSQMFDIHDNTTHNFGFDQPNDPADHLGLQAFDAISDVWSWLPGNCWDLDDAVCKQVVVNWAADAVGKNFYNNSPQVRQVFLTGEGPNNFDTVVHEVTHAVLDDIYEFVQIPGAGGPHSIKTFSTPGLAWQEGIAEWTPVAIYNEPSFNPPSGTPTNLETPKWGSPGWFNGDTVEGRVAGALIDISDSTNETPWDRMIVAPTPGTIWDSVAKHKPFTFLDFWKGWVQDNFNNVEPVTGLATLYQNTIQYGFRDPLSNNVAVIRPTPFTPHPFTYKTTTQFWSVVALRSPAGGNYDLRLFDDKPLTTKFIASTVAGTAIDFVAVNSNSQMQPLGDYYPLVDGTSGSGNCVVELAQGSLTLAPASSQSISMTGNKLVAVRDTQLTASVPVTIKVIPGLNTQDAELFILSPAPVGNEPKNFRARASLSNKAAVAFGPGGTETITFTPAVSGRYGVVVINKSGSGSYTLQRT